MKVRVLGSSAGGGFPQWNCNCTNCRGLRSGHIKAHARTQSSIAISNGNDPEFALINASPDLGQQLKEWQASQPGRAVRDTAIAGVVLIDSQIDHCAGLFSLREAGKLTLYCTKSVFDDLSSQLNIIPTLGFYLSLRHQCIPPRSSWRVDGIANLEFSALPLNGKSPPYCQHGKRDSSEHNIALEVTDRRSQKKLIYAPGLQEFDESFAQAVEQADCVLVDGTFWTDDEMAKHNISQKTAAQMGHLYLSGPGGMIEQLQKFPSKRRILIHINNTNPILNLDSAEKKTLDKAGIEVAYDGMEIDL